MRQDNLDQLAEGVAAFNRGDIPGMLAPFHPDVAFEPMRAVLDGTVYRGHEGVRRWLEDMVEDWEDFRVDVTRISELPGDRVLVEAQLRARGRASGIEVESSGAWLCDIRDDQVAHLRFYRDVETALADAGPAG